MLSYGVETVGIHARAIHHYIGTSDVSMGDAIEVDKFYTL